MRMKGGKRNRRVESRLRMSKKYIIVEGRREVEELEAAHDTERHYNEARASPLGAGRTGRTSAWKPRKAE